MTFRSAARCLICCATVFTAHAEIFTLKDGSTLEGTILREDGSSYVLEVQVTRSIKDERILAKQDVVKIEPSKLDLAAFESIAPLANIPDMLTAEQYSQRIQAVKTFLKEHRRSEKAKEARAILAMLEAESGQIAAGAIKINGKIITPAEYHANALDFDAAIEAGRIRAMLADGLYLRALRKFLPFDADFRNTRHHTELLPVIQQVIRTYTAQVEEELAGYEKRISEREAGLARMQMEDRRNTQSAINEQNAEFEQRLKREKDARLGWVSTDPYFKPSLEETLAFARQETNRLANIPATVQTDAGQAYRDALQKIQNAQNQADITNALNNAKTAMISQKYLALLEAAAASATSALAPKPSP